MRSERDDIFGTQITIAEVLRRWPAAADVFLHHRLACPGCAMAPFETLDDVAEAYRLDLSGLLGELQPHVDAAATRRERRER